MPRPDRKRALWCVRSRPTSACRCRNSYSAFTARFQDRRPAHQFIPNTSVAFSPPTPRTGSKPSFRSCFWKSSSAITFWVAASSRATIAAGVPTGAKIANVLRHHAGQARFVGGRNFRRGLDPLRRIDRQDAHLAGAGKIEDLRRGVGRKHRRVSALPSWMVAPQFAKLRRAFSAAYFPALLLVGRRREISALVDHVGSQVSCLSFISHFAEPLSAHVPLLHGTHGPSGRDLSAEPTCTWPSSPCTCW